MRPMAKSVAGVAFVDLWRWTCPWADCRTTLTRANEVELERVALRHWHDQHSTQDHPVLPAFE